MLTLAHRCYLATALVCLIAQSAFAAESHRVFLFRTDTAEGEPFPQKWNETLGRDSDVIVVSTVTTSGDLRGAFTRGHAARIAHSFEEAQGLAAASAHEANWVILDAPLETLAVADPAKWEGLRAACATGGLRLAVVFPLRVEATLAEGAASYADAILLRCEDAQGASTRDAAVETLRAIAGVVRSANAHCEIGCTLVATNDGQAELTSFVADTRKFLQSYALLGPSEPAGLVSVLEAIRTAIPSTGMYQTTFQPPKEPLNPLWRRRLTLLSLPLAGVTFAVTFLLVRMKKTPARRP